jgi:hypothetical protein
MQKKRLLQFGVSAHTSLIGRVKVAQMARIFDAHVGKS